MWLVAGLGNPGRKYSRTRHNIGFFVLDELAAGRGLLFQEKRDYRICRGSTGNAAVVLLEPLTFMNRSGVAVRAVTAKFNIPPERIIAVHDDLDMETGKLRIRMKGSSGGHRGIESIVQQIGSKDFVRVKIGIGRDPSVPVEDFVLSRFHRSEIGLIREAVRNAVEAIECIILHGPEQAMNDYN